ncbi:MAG: D-glycero-beta-D-manno-heptose 1,7-bisphosphate 7-phosphatase [Pseudomonadota bacterium]
MKLVILDRDGVINQDSADFIKSADEWIPIDGSLEAIAQLNQAGYQVVVVSNQSGIARGLFTLEDLHDMHNKMDSLLSPLGGRVDAVLFCPHGPDDGCPCRKPAPGMLLQVADRLGIDLRTTPFVGDSHVDIQAATLAGAQPKLVRTGKGEDTLRTLDPLPQGVEVFANLAEFVDAHLQE